MAEKNIDILDNSLLESAIEEMRKDFNADTQNKVINVSLRSTFLVPAVVEKNTELIADENNHLSFHDNHKARFILINHKEKGSFFPVFTSEDELRKLKTEEKFSAFSMSFADIAGLTENTPKVNGFVINPFNQNLPFTQDMLASIKATLIKLKEENDAKKNSENK